MVLVEPIFKMVALRLNTTLFLINYWSFQKKTIVLPAHDYNGKASSTIGSEIKNNPRLQVRSVDQYKEIMDNLNLANPKMMDIAVPANVKGLTVDQL